MNKHHPHPDDRQLQRFLNSECSELELKKVGRHIQGCPDCRTRLRAYLDMEAVLNQMPVLTAPADLEDRVMTSIGNELQGSRTAREALARHNGSGRVPRWRPELIHGLVATAATYVFVASGIMGRIMSINADRLGADVQSRVEAAHDILQRISIHLLS